MKFFLSDFSARARKVVSGIGSPVSNFADGALSLLDFYSRFSYSGKTMVVRMRHTRSHTKNRRSHHTVARTRISKDESGTPHVRHRMNPVTGKYRGREVVDVITKKAKKVAKKKESK